MNLSEKQLEELRDTVSKRKAISEEIGLMEFGKARLINDFAFYENKYNEFAAEMKEKYGDDVEIDLASGEIKNASNTLKKDCSFEIRTVSISSFEYVSICFMGTFSEDSAVETHPLKAFSKVIVF